MYEFELLPMYVGHKEESKNYFNDEQREQHLLTISSETGLLMTQGEIAHGIFAFVYKNGRAYGSGDNTKHHSDFLAGESVHFAGELYVVKGSITMITNSSGHYRPMSQRVGEALNEILDNYCRHNHIKVLFEDHSQGKRGLVYYDAVAFAQSNTEKVVEPLNHEKLSVYDKQLKELVREAESNTASANEDIYSVNYPCEFLKTNLAKAENVSTPPSPTKSATRFDFFQPGAKQKRFNGVSTRLFQQQTTLPHTPSKKASRELDFSKFNVPTENGFSTAGAFQFNDVSNQLFNEKLTHAPREKVQKQTLML